MSENLGVFSGSAHPELARRICEHLGLPEGKLKRSRFKSGEIYVLYEEGLRNRHVYLVQTFSNPINEHFVELMVMIDAAKRASAKSVTLVIPYFGYSRQERKISPRTPIGAKMVADILESQGVDRVITVDLHAPAIQGFFDIPVDHLTALDLLSQYIESKQITNPVIVSPDAGRAGTAEKLAGYLKYPLTMTLQKRTAEGEPTITHIIGEVENRTPIIIEDIIDTGSTIVKVVEALKKKGANDAFVCATHPVFSGPTLQRLKHPHIREVVVTDTIPLSEECPEYIKVLSVSHLLAEAIRINMFGGSISTLFKIKSVY